MLSAFAGTRLDARMGDPSGSRDYTELSTEPLSKWKRTFAQRVPEGVGAAVPRLDRAGAPGARWATTSTSCSDELASIPNRPKGLVSDAWRGAYGRATQLRRDRALHRLTKRGRW